MLPFRLEMPRVIHFGTGALDRLPEALEGLGKRALVVTGSRSFDDASWRSRLESGLGGFATEIHRCAPGEPSSSTLAVASEAALRFDPDVIVGVGGGSVIDTAKALSVLVRHPGPAERFLEGVPGSGPVPEPVVPWVAIPTTAGTGAEVTKNSVVRSEAAGVKRSMRSALLLARAAIVDPLLTLTLSRPTTGATGLDALTQLVEAYVCRAGNPFVSAIVEGAFPPMLRALERLPSDLSNVQLRTDACYGALVSGIALANAGLGAAHGFAAAVGGAHEVPHGLACAVFLPRVLAANAPVIRERIERLVAPVRDGGPRDPVEWLAARVTWLLAAFDLPADLKEFGIPRRSLPELAERASGSSMRGNPREMSMDERMEILSAVV